ncbi:MAG: peptidylprolyl isomerase [Ruminococcus sp.]|nr:peptidylprolyl isomerase [Ruminococcus sp.]
MGLFTGCGSDDSGNKFIVTLYPDVAPITCENFQSLVEAKFYDGLTFHRVIDKFMAQGGDPAGDGTGKGSTAEKIKGEFAANGVENNLAHTRGVVSMARGDDMNSASSQFFICYEASSHLDGNYAAFGLVTEGMEVVDGFLDIKRTTGLDGAESKPVSDIVIKSAKMISDDKDGNPRVEFIVEY